MPSMLFTASYDSTTKVVSGAVSVVLILIFVALQNPWVGGLSLLVVAAAYAYSPRGYRLSEDSLVIQRLIRDVRIPLREIQEARTAEADDFRGCIRLWGSGGFFGYYGLFRTSKLGTSTWYMTNRGNAVVVRSSKKTVVLSPDDRAGFVSMLRASAPFLMTSSGVQPQPAVIAAGGFRAGVFIGVSVALAVAGIIAAAVFYSPGPPEYTLTPDSLAIRDRFYPVTLNAAAVDVEHVRIVDLSTDPDWRPTLRTNGFANTHYSSGWFRVANGHTVRMYRANGNRLVLLPPKSTGPPTLLEVNEPAEFVRRVQREWAGR